MKVIHALTAIPVSRSYLGARAAGLHPALCGREAVCRINKPSGVGVNHASCSPLPALAGRSGCGNRVL